MGIESDQLVFDYLSRVGDLAQQRQLPSGERARLVTELRGEIERRRAKAIGADSPATVRRILARMGTPDEIVTAAGARAADGATADGEPTEGGGPGPGGAGSPAGGPSPVGAGRPLGGVSGRPGGKGTGGGTGALRLPWAKKGRAAVPPPRAAQDPTPVPPPSDSGTDTGGTPATSGGAVSPPPGDAPSPPHLAGPDELGPSTPDWWRIDPEPLGGTDLVPGFSGGIEVPEIMRPPSAAGEPGDKGGGDPAGAKGPGSTLEKDPAAPGGTDGTKGTGAGGAKAGVARGLLGALRRRARSAGQGDAAPAPAKRVRLHWSNPLPLLAAALLVAGVVLGFWLALALGWALAYASRRLTPVETKLAVLWLPGLALAAGVVWLWGRQSHRWGEPIAEGHMSDAIAATWPWVVRGAALASAAFLIWRSQRTRK